MNEFNIEELTILADSGDHAAQAKLSIEFMIGKSVDYNLGKALDYLEKAAEDIYTINSFYKSEREKNIPEAYFGLAMMWKHGWGVPESIERYSENIKSAANLGFARAQYLLGLDYQSNIYGVKQDLHNSEFWLLKSLESGITDAHLQLYHLYSAKNELYNIDKAIVHLRKSAESNDGMGQIYLGRHYLNGNPDSKGKIEAAMWFILAKKHNRWDVKEVDIIKEKLIQKDWDEAIRQADNWLDRFNTNNK